MNTEITLAVSHGHPITTSLQVADKFGKLHKNVLRDIENLECSPEFHRLNFEPMSYLAEIGNGGVRENRAYNITRDGFTFLAMGFTGKEAALWKEKYIAAFNAMEAALQKQDDTAAFHKARTFAQITRQFHTTVAALRKDHGLRQAYLMANAEAKTANGVSLIDIWQLDPATLPDITPPEQRKKDRILDCIGNANHYVKDKAYGKLCKAGFMPFGKLNILTKMKARDLANLLRKLEAEGRIKEIDDETTSFVQCYVLTGEAA